MKINVEKSVDYQVIMKLIKHQFYISSLRFSSIKKKYQ